MRRLVLAAAALAMLAACEKTTKDEQLYSVFLAAVEACEKAFPQAAGDFKPVRANLDALVLKYPKLAAAVKSRTFPEILQEARVEMDKHLARSDKALVCGEVRNGRFGQMEIK